MRPCVERAGVKGQLDLEAFGLGRGWSEGRHAQISGRISDSLSRATCQMPCWLGIAALHDRPIRRDRAGHFVLQNVTN